MRRRYKMMLYALGPIVGASMLGAGAVSAHGFLGDATPDDVAERHRESFQRDADTFGFSLDEIKNAWAEGKGPLELAKEKGMTDDQIRQKLEEARARREQSMLDALVDKGVITKAQAEKRLSAVRKKALGGPGGFGPRHFGGLGRGGHRH